MVDRIAGTIKAFDRATGRGFIERQGGPDIFFHVSAVRSKAAKTLRVGQTVEFSLEKGATGPQAVDIVIKSKTPGKKASGSRG